MTAVVQRPTHGSVEDAVDALRRGLPVIVLDDEDREDEGDVVLAAQHATPQWIAWTVRHTSGVLCAPMPHDWADRLALPPMVGRNEDPRGTAYTVSADARHGIGTGISAADRATTLRLLGDPTTSAGDLVRPGHVFPLRARPGGVLERPGHTEAGVDLCRLAGLAPVAVIAEVVADDGEPMRLPGLRRLAAAHGLPLLSVAALVRHLRDDAPQAAGPPAAVTHRRDGARVASVERVAQAALPTRHGTFTAIGYRDRATGDEHVALLPERPGTLVRLHSECLTGDALGSLRCDCGPQLRGALEQVAVEGGALLYLGGHEGRGIGLLPKLVAYALQDTGLDTVAANLEQGLPADARSYAAAAAILADLGLRRVRLLTNNPAKVAGLQTAGIEVVERIPHLTGATASNAAYLATKRDLMGHQLPGTSRSTGTTEGDER